MSPGQLISATDYRLDYVHIHYVCVQMLHDDNNWYVHDTAPVKHKIVSVIRTHSLVIRIHALWILIKQRMMDWFVLSRYPTMEAY